MAAPSMSSVSKLKKGVGEVLSYGNRTFYRLPSQDEKGNVVKRCSVRDEKALMSFINENVIGCDTKFSGAFGQRQVVYCDYTASGRSLRMIEDYIRHQVLPLYGNTHTTTTVTSLQTTLYRHEARDIIRNAVNASEHDAVIFVGTGCTAAVHKLIHALNLQSPPVVFVGPFEHHSNLLPWREIGSEVVRIKQTAEGLVDMNCLESQLKKWHLSGRQLIGCFSAASNITGILSDDIAITVMLHRYGAMALWDYATAGPYVDINMNPIDATNNLPASAYKDAIFLSPHKFIGGVETPGILVAKKSLFVNPVPSGAGGGSVFFVSPADHRYLKEVEMREEGGTPSIVGAVRAGLAFQLKEAVGAKHIMAREHELCRRAVRMWSDCPNLVLLGNTAVPRLPIFSFLIRHPVTRQFLHHNFVCAVLNDVFGIQARGGCACAGPYAQDLLGIDEELAKEIESMLLEDSRLDRVHLRRYTEYSEREILRPGFTRLNLPYFVDNKCVDFVLQAVTMTAEHAWKLLPQYIFNPETGEWKQRSHQVFQDRRWLGSISYSSGRMKYPEPSVPKPKGRLPTTYQDCLNLAKEIFKKAEKVQAQLPDQTLLFDPKASDLRWFMLPSEALAALSDKSDPSHHALPKKLPFEPVQYKQRSSSIEENGDRNDEAIEMFLNSIKTEKSESVNGDGANFNDEHITQTSFKNDGVQRACNAVSESRSAAKFFEKTYEKGFVEDAQQITGILRVPVDDIAHKKTNIADEIQSECKVERGKTQNGDFVPSSDVHLSSVEHHGSFSNHESTFCVKDDLTLNDRKTVTDKHKCKGMGLETSTFSNLEAEASINTSVPKQRQSISLVNENQTLSDIEEVKTSVNGKSNVSNNSKAGWSSDQELPRADKTSPSKPRLSNERESLRMVVEKPVQENTVETQEMLSCASDRPHGLVEEPLSNHVQLDESRSLKCSKSKKNTGKELSFQKPPKCIFKPTVEALEEYKMIEDGDRVLVCLSGGKDSLSLLHTLRQYQFYAKSKGILFELGGVTVDPQTSAYDPRPLIPYLASLGVPYFYEEQCIIDMAANIEGGCDSICSFCSRMKRGRLYACARREGYNVLAMGQHLDDLAESFLMSAFHNGFLRTMKANYTVKEGDLRVIRPFVYTREKDLRNFAQKAQLPVIPENCPACFEAPKERHRMKQLLASQELLFPRLYSSLQTAMKPLMAKNKTGMESSRKKEQFFDEGDL